jgi:hypothetical protein
MRIVLDSTDAYIWKLLDLTLMLSRRRQLSSYTASCFVYRLATKAKFPFQLNCHSIRGHSERHINVENGRTIQRCTLHSSLVPVYIALLETLSINH